MVASLIQQNKVGESLAPVDYEYSTTGEIFGAAFDNQVYNFNWSSEVDVKLESSKEASDKFLEFYQKQYGRTVWEDKVLDPTIARWKQTEVSDRFIKQWRDEGVVGADELISSTEADDIAIQKARDAGIDYQEKLMRAAPDAWAMLGSFGGAIAGWFSEPFNAGSVIVTAPLIELYAARAAWGGYFSRLATMEGSVGATIEAAAQPSIMSWQKEIGNEYTMADAWSNVAIAGFAGFGLTYGLSRSLNAVGLYDVPQVANNLKATKVNDSIDIPPREGDSGTLTAHEENMNVMMSALSDGRMPDPLNYNPASLPKSYIDDGVNQTHWSIAADFAISDTKLGLNAASKKNFIDDAIRDLEVDAELNRVDRKNTKKIISEIDESIKTLNIKAEEFLARQKKLSNKKSLTKKDTEELVALDGDIKAVAKDLSALYRKKDGRIKADKATKVAERADEMLPELRKGKIPKSIKKDYDAFQSNTRQAFDEIQRRQKQTVQLADDLMSGKVTPTKLARVAEQAKKSIDDAASPEFGQAIETEFKRSVDDWDSDPKLANMEVMDGKTMRELADELAEEVNEVQAISACWRG